MSLEEAVAEYRAAQAAVADAKAALHLGQDRVRAARQALTDEIVREARAGTRMRDLVAKTGLSREMIRTRLRENGVYADE